MILWQEKLGAWAIVKRATNETFKSQFQLCFDLLSISLFASERAGYNISKMKCLHVKRGLLVLPRLSVEAFIQKISLSTFQKIIVGVI